MVARNAEGCIYFIQAEGGGPIKVGFAAYPLERLAELQVSHAEELVIRAFALGTSEDEIMMHRRLAAHRLRGEWFADHADVVAAMEEARARGDVMPVRPPEAPIDRSKADEMDAFIRRTFPLILRQAYGHLPRPKRAIAQDAGSTLRSAENWWEGRVMAQTEQLLGLCRHSEAVFLWFRLCCAASEVADADGVSVEEAAVLLSESPERLATMKYFNPEIMQQRLARLEAADA